jgi:hypothetical protein
MCAVVLVVTRMARLESVCLYAPAGMTWLCYVTGTCKGFVFIKLEVVGFEEYRKVVIMNQSSYNTDVSLKSFCSNLQNTAFVQSQISIVFLLEV